MFKFLHIADIHFDAPLASVDPQLGQELKSSQKKAFRRAVDRCIDEQVDGLIIAGDLFDNERIALDTEKFLTEEFERLAGEEIAIFYAPGNHDPVIAMPFKFKDNVHVFDRDDPQEVILEDGEGQRCRIVGVGHLSDREKRNLIRKFPIKTDDMLHVGVAHAMVESVEAAQEKGRYLPTSVSDLEKTGYDYWALGHIHQRQQIKGLPIHYSGAIQGLNINETGVKGGNLVTLADGEAVVSFVPLSDIVYAQCDLDVSGEYESEMEFYQKLRGMVNEALEVSEGAASETILRIWISGRTNMMRYLKQDENILYLEEEVAKDLGLKALEIKRKSLFALVSFEEMLKENPVMGEIIDLLDHPEEDERFMEALKALKFRTLDDEKPIGELLGEHREQLIENLMLYFMGDRS